MSTLPIFKDDAILKQTKPDIIVKEDDLVVDNTDTEIKESIAKNLGGRPMEFNEITLAKRIDEYFEDCKERSVNPTIGRLAVFLDVDRKTLLNYQKSERFFHIIKSAREEISANVEELLINPNNRNSTGSIFYAKNNMGYVDRIETVTKDGDLAEKQKMLDQFSTDVDKFDQISRNLNSRFLTE